MQAAVVVCQPVNEDRLIEIETKLTHQEDLLAQLNDALTQQQAQLSELHERCRLLQEKFDSLDSGEGGSAEPETPPHY